MVDNIIYEHLFSLGLSQYEARVYLSQLEDTPMTAYQIAKKSSIPTSKIYEVLIKLLSKEMILEIEEDDKKKYIAKPVEEFLDSAKSRFDNTIDELKIGLRNFGKQEKISYIWNITDYQYFIDKAQRMIKETKTNLLLSCWKNELDILGEIILKQKSNGIKVAILHFGKTDFKCDTIFQHPIEDTIYSEKGGRGFVLITDSKESLMGTIFSDGRIEGASSKNSGFVTMAEDYIKHDIYIMKIVERFDPALIRKFGENYKYLRDIYSNIDI